MTASTDQRRRDLAAGSPTPHPLSPADLERLEGIARTAVQHTEYRDAETYGAQYEFAQAFDPDACLALVRALREATEWRAISEAKRDGTEMFLGGFDPNGNWRTALCSWRSRFAPTKDDDDAVEEDFGWPWFQVEPTHFRPLQSPPQQEER